LNRWVCRAAVAAIAAVYGVVSVQRLACPGLGYDEVMWTNAALGFPDAWVSLQVGRWPVLLGLPYIGALKGYLYRPLLALAAPSIAMVRLPMIALGIVSIVATYLVAQRMMTRRWALLSTALLAFSPEFVIRIRHDLGPVAPDVLLRVGALYLAVRAAEKFEARHLAGFWILATLGVWQKLTFIWYVNAYVLAFALVFGADWWRQIGQSGARRRLLALAANLGPYLVNFGWVAWIYVRWNLPASQAASGTGYGTPFHKRMWDLTLGMWRQFQGTDSINYFQDPYSPAGGSAVAALFVIAMVFTAAQVAVRLRSRMQVATRPQDRLAAFVIVAVSAVAVQLAMTPPADKPWHRLALQPFIALLVGHGIMSIAAAVPVAVGARLRRAAAATLYAALGLGVLGFYALVGAHYAATVCEHAPTQASWNWAIHTNRVSDLLDVITHSKRRFVFLDWGMRNQALLLTRDPGRVVEVVPHSMDDQAANRLAAVHLRAGSTDAIVLHGERATCFSEPRRILFALAKKKGLRLHRFAVIEEAREPVFEFWELRDPVPRGGPGSPSGDGGTPPPRTAD
jgi:hypothetical protein